MRRSPTIMGVLACTASTPLSQAEPVRQNFWYPSSVTTDLEGPLDLLAELNYDDARPGAPIVVVMHGFSPVNGNLSNVRSGAQRLRQDGFFAISVALRGRDDADGVRDSSGLEIWDIFDAVESVKTTFPDLVDPTNVHIVGFSGGGGNTMAALTKFPDYFNLGASFYGMSDYGEDPDDSWWFRGSASSHRAILQNDIGDPATGDPDVHDAFQARNHADASHNNPYSEIHLFHNFNESICPPINHFRFRFNAMMREAFPGEFDITIHEGGLGQYVDFNNNGADDPDELQNWPHSFPTANQQDAAQSHYIDRVLAGEVPQPVLNSGDTLRVAGFVSTRPFTAFVGDGQQGAARLDYEVLGSAMRVGVESLGEVQDRPVTVTLRARLGAGDEAWVYAPGDDQPTEVLNPDDGGAVAFVLTNAQTRYVIPVFAGSSGPDARTIADLDRVRDDTNASGLTGELRAFAESVATVCAPDLVADGSLDFNDIVAFLGAFAAGDPVAAGFAPPAGAVDFNDAIAFLTRFAVGCP